MAQLDELRGKEFGIDPTKKYDRKKFAFRSQLLFDVDSYRRRLRESVGDYDALNNLANIAVNFMTGRKEDNLELLLENTNIALDKADELYRRGGNAMAKYVENNRDKIMGELSAEQLARILLRVKLFKSGKKEHDNTLKLIEKYKEIRKAYEQKEDVASLSLVQDKVRELIENAPDRDFILRHNIFRHKNKYVNSFAEYIAGAIMAEFNDRFGKRVRKRVEGKVETVLELDKDKIRKYLENNWKVIEDFIDKIPDIKRNQEQRYEYWKNLRDAYIEVAREFSVTQIEEEEKKEHHEDKERQIKAKNIGMRVPDIILRE